MWVRSGSSGQAEVWFRLQANYKFDLNFAANFWELFFLSSANKNIFHRSGKLWNSPMHCESENSRTFWYIRLDDSQVNYSIKEADNQNINFFENQARRMESINMSVK